MNKLDWQEDFFKVFDWNRETKRFSDAQLSKILISSKCIFPELIHPWAKHAIIQIEELYLFNSAHGEDLLIEEILNFSKIISDHAQFIFYDGFHQYRKKHAGLVSRSLRKGNAKERLHADFFGYKESLVLAEMLTELTASWVNEVFEFCSRFELDLVEIQKKFGMKCEDHVTSIAQGLSDRHNCGRTVRKILFSSGIKVMYKPRKMDPEVFMEVFLKFMSNIGISPPFKTPVTIDKITYGWQLFVETTSFDTINSVENYFFNVGRTLAIFKLLGTTDIHEENLIVTGVKPYLVDLETVIQPNYMSVIASATPAIKSAKEALRDSVFNTSMLPIWTESLNGSPMLCGALTDQLKVVVKKWTAVNLRTDKIRYVNKRMVVKKGASNIVFLNGKKCKTNKYVPQVSFGMTCMWKELCEKRSELLTFFQRYPNFEFRVLPRSTVVYGALLKNLRNPKVQYNMVVAKAAIEVKYDEAPPIDSFLMNPTFISAELKALKRLDVPIFTSCFDSVNLKSECGEILNVFDLSPRGLVSDKLMRMDESDISTDLKIIRISLGNDRTVRRKKKEIQSVVVRSVEMSRIDTKTQDIFNLVKNEAFRKDGTATWICKLQASDKSIGIDTMLSGLYGGLGGLGIFTAAYHHRYNTKDSYDLTNEIINSIEAIVEKNKLFEFEQVGLDGIIGTVYSLLTIAKLTANSKANFLANTLLGSLESRTNFSIGGYDLLYTTVGLLALWNQDGLSASVRKTVLLPTLNCLMNDCQFQKVLESIVNKKCDSDVLLGLGHGLAGLYLALGKIEHDDITFREFHDAVELAILAGYERETQRWPFYISHPLRLDHPGSIDFHKWCHGSVGIGLAACVNFGRKNANRILDLTMNSLSAGLLSNVDFLCCGNAGKLEFAIELEKRFTNRKDISMLKLKLLKYILYKREFTLEERENRDNISFFRGVSGIGYALLRSQNPQLPCVASLE